MIVVPSRKQPSTSRMTLTSSRKPTCDRSVAVRMALTVFGMFSMVIT